MKTAALYVRVSTAKRTAAGDPVQNVKLQVAALAKLVRARRWRLVLHYEDAASGANSTRPGYRQLMEDARRGRFEVVVVWRFDRFARSTKELITALDEFRALGIDFVSHQEAIDTSTPAGKLMFTMVAAFAEFERCIIQERVRAGMAHAREYGTRSGNSIGRPKKVFSRDLVRKLRRGGASMREIARRLHVGLGTVQRSLTGHA